MSGGLYYILKIRQAREDFGNVCHWNGCKTRDGLEFAHRRGFEVETRRGRGSNVRYKYIKLTPAFLILLCKTHHLKYDNTFKDEFDLDWDLLNVLICYCGVKQ